VGAGAFEIECCDRADHDAEIKAPGTLLCAANFPANEGYAWDFIEGLYARVADRIAPSGIVTFVAYPSIESAPKSLATSRAQPVALDVSLRTPKSLWQTRAFVRRHGVRVAFFTDHAAFSPAYWWLRLAGVRYIMVYDHTSGIRTPPRGIKFVLKWLVARLPGIVADRVLTVSDFVAERTQRVGLIPQRRVKRVWNGIALPAEGRNACVRKSLGIADDRPLVVCCSRAVPEKGIEYLLRAFDRVIAQTPRTGRRPLLAYVGDGPDRPRLEAARASLASRADIIFVGYRRDVREYIRAADLCVVPSIWMDALPLGVLESMAFGKPVIATRVGGIPEMVRDGIDGLLVPPGEVEPLACAIVALLSDPARAARLGQQARARVAEHFRPEDQIAALVQLVQQGFSVRRATGATRGKTAQGCGDLHILAGREPLQMGWYAYAASLAKGRTVLDVGCGSGEGLKLLAAKASHAVGIDLDEQLRSDEPKIEIRSLSSVPDKSYDVVVCIDVIEHVKDDVGFARDLARVARETLFVSTPNYALSHNRHPYHVREYLPQDFEDLFRPLGRVTILAGDSAGKSPLEIRQRSKRLYYFLSSLYAHGVTAIVAKVLRRLLRVRILPHQAVLVRVASS
jgi:glycosyltransferase involved in cell wall biosynthesis/SAM-dependent methyltransferase